MVLASSANRKSGHSGKLMELAPKAQSPLNRENFGTVESGIKEYFRCPDKYDSVWVKQTIPARSGFFRYGQDAICYGSYHRQQRSAGQPENLADARPEVFIQNGKVYLPFNPAEVISNLSHEVYADASRSTSKSLVASLYYWLRPALPVAVRRHLQRLRLKDWNKIPFPQWPVDCSINNLAEHLMLLTLRASGKQSIPFIWFWPEGYSSCAAMTHDVETQKGLNFCSALMDINDSFGIKSSFQIIPEDRYSATPEQLDEIKSRGFEVCVHDLNHDGHLFRDRDQFFQRAAKINEYGKKFGAEGFRSAILYRKQDWYHALEFAYDMSVPNVAHLDPQRGGCCTVMPYFLNGILEIPVTTIQDYSLFHILNDYSISIWKQQTSIISAKRGLMSFIVHPDYIMTSREQSVYKELLGHLARMRDEDGVWITTPGEINHWWRQRAAMQLVEDRRGWRVEGVGCERARIAHASEENGRLVLSVPDAGSRNNSQVSTIRA
jgi:hypothetical protein